MAENNFPEKTKKDELIDACHIFASMIPGVSLISEYVKSFHPQGFEKRLENWLKCLAEEVDNMPEKIQKQLNTFFNEEEGKTLLFMATQSAITTHKTDKLKTLRNILFNVSCDSVNYDEKEIYLQIAIDLEPYDIHLLQIINENDIDFSKIESYEDAFIVAKNNDFIGNKDVFFLMINKLKDKSLIRISRHIDEFNDVYEINIVVGISEKTKELQLLPKLKITDFGKRFLMYLEELI